MRVVAHSCSSTLLNSLVLCELKCSLVVRGTKIGCHAYRRCCAQQIILATNQGLYPVKLHTYSHCRSLSGGQVREDRLLCLQTLLHTADLGNPCKPWNIHIQWTHAIVAEFFSQGDLERGQGEPVSFMCDRNENCGRSSQKNFIINFVRPLFVLCGLVVPQVRA